MKVDLKSMNRKELEKLLNDTKKELQNTQARERRQARKAAEKAAAEFGFSLDDLAEEGKNSRKGRKTQAKPKGSKKPKSSPQFANPADASQTWTGKGRQPNWYREEIAKGTTPEKMKI